MRRVKQDAEWTLFSPQLVPLLSEKHGLEFDLQYETYEMSDVPRHTVRARDVWNAIVESQIETGGPFMLYKDAINSRYCRYLTISADILTCISL